MPSSFRSGGKSNLRRLPDTSDASFSFQIPTGGLGDDYLLDNDDESFLKATDDILATPAPSRVTLEPLTINDLTPGPSKPSLTSLKSTPKQIRSRSTLTSAEVTPARRTSARIQEQQSRTKPRSLARLAEENSVPQSPAGERIESLKAQLGVLTDELKRAQEPIPLESPKQAAVPTKQRLRRREAPIQQKETAKPAVVGGGASKVRPQRGVRRSSIARYNPSAVIQHTVAKDKVLPAITSPDRHSTAPEDKHTIKSDSSVGLDAQNGVANNLVTSSQDLVNTHVTPIAEQSKAPTTLSQWDDVNQSPDHPKSLDMDIEPELAAAPVFADVNPLTVSQLSPSKHSARSSSVERNQVGVAAQNELEVPLRTSSKRPASVEGFDEVEGGRTRKKGKVAPTVGASGAPSSSSAPSSSKHAAAAPSAKRLAPTSRKSSGKSIRRPSSSGQRARSSIVGRKSLEKSGAIMRSRNSTIGSRRSERVKVRESLSGARRSDKEDEDHNEPDSAQNQEQNYSEESTHLEDQNRNRDRWEPNPSSAEHSQATPARSKSPKMASGSRSTSSKVNIVHATVPVGFNFRVNARLEARKGAGTSEAGASSSSAAHGGSSQGAKASLAHPKASATRTALGKERGGGGEKGKGKARSDAAGVAGGSRLSRPAPERAGAKGSTSRTAGAPSASRSQQQQSTTTARGAKVGDHVVPDFKALHASHAAELERKKQRLLRESRAHPVIPVSPRFETKHRLKERQKFDEKIREKEKRLKEERDAQRRAEEEQQEREVKELRKRAVPKAHEVPEWYRDAPKKVK